MTDKEFIDYANATLQELHTQRMQLEEQARVTLIIEKKFKPMFFRLLEEHKFMERIWIFKKDFLDESDNIDIRKCMSDELINIAAEKGFIYILQHSTSDSLDFHKTETKNLTK